MSEAQTGDVLVLHVDDDPGFSDLVADYLEREGERFEVATAASADAGLKVLEERAVDCVVSDYEMPGRDGLEFLRTVRERYGDPPFVLFTGKGSEEIASEAISAGVDDYLQKRSGSEQYTILANRVENLVSRRRAADAAAESEERYHNLVDTAPASIGLFDSDGKLVYANDAAADLLGYEDPAAMEGTAMNELVHPEDRELARERFERLHGEGEMAPETSMRLVTAEGEVRHVRVASSPGVYRGEPVAQAALKEVPGEDAGAGAVGGDRDAVVKDEEALLWRALDSLEDAFYVLDERGRPLLWNERVNELTGADDAELAEADPTAFFAAGDSEAVAASVERVLETGSAVVEAGLETPDGRAPFEFRGHRLTDDDGRVLGLAGIGRNVADRRRRERALRELNAFAADIAKYTDVEQVCERAVEAAEAVLEFDRSVINVEEDGRLPVTATTSEVSPDGAVEMSVEEGLAGLTYREGRSFLLDDVTEHPAANPQGPYRAAVSVPIGDHGVLQAVDEEQGSFDENDRELAELLAAHCAAALDRIDREGALQE